MSKIRDIFQKFATDCEGFSDNRKAFKQALLALQSTLLESEGAPKEERKDTKDCIELKGYKNGYNQANAAWRAHINKMIGTE